MKTTYDQETSEFTVYSTFNEKIIFQARIKKKTLRNKIKLALDKAENIAFENAKQEILRIIEKGSG